ncbi:MAG: geranylgeranylglycerol-phosphate geranylgeranyltransferase [Candidatus Zixiibacteriota bacterium]
MSVSYERAPGALGALGALRLIRLQNCLIAAAAVIIGGYLQTGSPRLDHLLLFALAAGLICGSGNAFNDLLDIESDRINHPGRPLPSGSASPRDARVAAVTGSVLGLTISALLTPTLFMTAASVTALLLWYNLALKRSSLYGNLMIAALGALTVFSGGVASGAAGVASGAAVVQLPGSAFPALMAFLLHFAREMIKDVHDLGGDSAAGLRTFPIRVGATQALRIISLTVALIVLASLLPLVLNWYGAWYSVAVILGVDLPLAVALFRVRRATTSETLSQASLAFKLAMVMGLLAVSLESELISSWIEVVN